MGKKSLIKSTTKKKTGAKKEEEKTTKKTATKSTKQATSKTASKPAAKKAKKTTTTTKKKAAATAKKAAPKKAAPKKAAPKKAAPKKAAAKPKAAPKKAKPTKKVTIKELIFKKFETSPPAGGVLSAPKPTVSTASAPALITSTDPKEVERLKALLFNKYDMEEIKAVAKEPEPLPEPKAEESSPLTEPSAGTEEPETQAAMAPADQTEAESAYITVESSTPKAGAEPMNRTLKIAVAAAAAIVFFMLAISYSNSSKFYIQPKDNAIEIWKGRFSPKDTKFFMVLHGIPAVEPIKEVYTKAEVFPLIFDYYVDKADTLLEVPGLPDFEGIKAYLHQAEDYIVTTEMDAAVSARLNNIERMILLYKADVAISKNTDNSLETAIKLLKKAGKLTPSAVQAEEINQKIELSRERRANLKQTTE